MLGRSAASIKGILVPYEGALEAARNAAYQQQIDYVRQLGFEQGMTAGEVEAYVHLAQRTGQEQEQTMAGMLDPQALAISNAASDVALRLLRDEIRESGLFSGLGQFDIGALISTAVSAAGTVASNYIQGRTASTVAREQASLVAAQERMQAQQLALQEAASRAAAQGSSVLPAGFTQTLAQPTVWIPVALAGGALALFLMLRK